MEQHVYFDYHDTPPNYYSDDTDWTMFCPIDETPPPLPPICQEVFFAIVCLVGLVGNSLIIYVVVRFTKLQTVTNIYMVNLAIADGCLLITIPFKMVAIVKKSWIFGALPCKAYHMLATSNQFSTTIFLLIMSKDCYHAVSTSRFRTQLVASIATMAAWLYTILLISPLPTAEEDKHSCIDALTMENITEAQCISGGYSYGRELYITFTFSFAIPLILILEFYRLIRKKLKAVGPHESNEEMQALRKDIKLVFSLVTLHFCCAAPEWLLKIAIITDVYHLDLNGENFIQTLLMLLVVWLRYANSAMNPILYAFLSDDFRKNFLIACSCATGKDIEDEAFQRQDVQDELCPNKEDECEVGPLVSEAEYRN